MLRFIKKKHHSRLGLKYYFPIFSAVILCVLFSICVVHYSKRPLFFAGNPFPTIGSYEKTL